MADDERTSGLRLAGVGLEFAAAVAGLSLLGYWIDRHYGTGPWGLLIGAGIGLVGGTYNLIRAALAGPRGGRRDGAGGSGAGAAAGGPGGPRAGEARPAEDRREPRPPAGGAGG